MKRRNLCITCLAGGVALLGGTAAAVALPGAASPTAGDQLTQHNVTVPAPDDHAGTHPEGTDTGAAGADNGSTISSLATTTSSTGVDKGAEISSTASDGQSQAGQQTADDATASAPVETPNTGGTTTADTASSGASAVGTGIADDASDGRAAAGSGNAEAGLSHKP